MEQEQGKVDQCCERSATYPKSAAGFASGKTNSSHKPNMLFKRFIVGADNHGDLVCPKAVKKFLDFTSDWKPHYRIHLGDFVDAAYLRNGAGQEEKAHGITDDFNQGMKFLEQYRPHILTLGNHCDRVWQTSHKQSDGFLREACADLANGAERRFKQMGIKWIPYQVSRSIQMPEGGPQLIHGFRSSVNPAKAHFDNWGPCIHGHVHTPDEYTARHINGSQAFSVGCLADISKLSYADRSPAKLGWRQGFLYGYINTKTGKWNAWNVKNEDGDWISPMGVL